MLLNLETVHDFYFKAMLKGGYTTDVARTTIKELPGSKVITFEDGDLRLVDCWHTNGPRSCGNTTIFSGQTALWNMSYHGEYPKEILGFLKSVLRHEYDDIHRFDGDRQFFNGCRGPRVVQAGALWYMNMIAPGSYFGNFSGREEVHFSGAAGFELYGYHEYRGFSLIG